MKTDPCIDRPIFIIGSGRSGTTILYNILCGHSALAWFSNYSQRWPRFPQVAFLSPLYTVEFLRRHPFKGFPTPAEGHGVWDYCKPVADSPGDPPLTEADAGPEVIARARRVVALHARYQRKPRFINKNTRNTRRIRFLNLIFPDALFIHVIRDPRASVASFLNVDFWPTLKIWCCNKITPTEWAAQDKDPIILGAKLWAANVQRALDDQATLPAERSLQVHYEDLMERPQATLSGTLQFTQLAESASFERFAASFRLKNMNFKYRSQFSADQIAAIQHITFPLAARLGYQPD